MDSEVKEIDKSKLLDTDTQKERRAEIRNDNNM